MYNVDLRRPFTHEEAVRILFGTPACPFGVYGINKMCPSYALKNKLSKYDDADCHRCVNEYFEEEKEK